MVRALKVKLVSFLMTSLIDQTTRADSTCKVDAHMEIIAGNFCVPQTKSVFVSINILLWSFKM